jgi:hypothetical protein
MRLQCLLGHLDKAAMQSTHIDDTTPITVETTILAIVVTWAGEFLALLEDDTGEGLADDARQASF